MNIYPHIYTYIHTFILTLRQKEFFMTRLFLFYTQNKSFCNRVISLVQYQKVLQCNLPFYLPS